MKENTVLKDVVQWIQEKADQNNLKVGLGKKRLLGNQNNFKA